MKSVVAFLFLIGVIMIVLGYQKEYKKCPGPAIEYRFIPRTFYDEQLSSPNLLKEFSAMFEEENIWIKDRSGADIKKNIK
jgi:hypothetical protein